MHSGSLNFERRLAALEQRRSQTQTMRILHPGCHQHHGFFIVKAGTATHTEQRAPEESWNDFACRMDQHATGVLKILQFMPISDEGEQLFMNDEPQEYLQ